ncbi:MAG: D-alanyl-D-alanine carboxypeptidase/D-alanyl-D-alanine-endopeptidase [Sumerlaeia bacterium]
MKIFVRKIRSGWAALFSILIIIPALLPSQTIPEALDDVLDGSTIIDYNWGYVIESNDGSTEYYGRNANLPMVPASNTKIYTTAAAFELLGEEYAFRTRVFHTGTRNGSTITGNLILFGEHDITWHNDVLGSGNANAALRAIAIKVRNAGITTVSGSVVGQGAMIYNKSSTGTDHSNLSATATMNAQAAAEFRTQLVAQGVSVSGGSSGSTGFTAPGGSSLLVTYLSTESRDSETNQPLDLAEACIALNKASHNPMADYLMRHIGYQLTGTDTYSAGTAEAISWLQNTVGIDTTGIVLNDGSGLNNRSKVTAYQTTQLVRYTAERSPRWVETLPIGGVDGTLGGRFFGTLQNRVFAKTGTLGNSGSVALSGFIVHPLDEQRYYFSVYANTDALLSGSTGAINTTLTRNGMDACLNAFASFYPPLRVDLLSTQVVPNNKVRLEWSDPAFTTNEYTVYQATAGLPALNILTVGPTYIIESGVSTTSLGLNNSDYSDTGAFANSTSHSTAPGLTPELGSRFIVPTSGVGIATFTPSNLPEGRYKVDVTCFNFSSADAHNVTVSITERNQTGGNITKTGRFELTNQTAGDLWRNVGTIDFVPGSGHSISFSNSTQTSTGSNDRMNPAAVRFIPLFAEVNAPVGSGLTNYSVRAVGPRGFQSKQSNEFSTRQNNASLSKALIVDGFDRWDRTQADNPERNFHAFVPIHADSLSAVNIDSVANEWVERENVNLQDYDSVFWVLGEESTADETFSVVEQQLVRSYLESGKNLFVSGSEIAWDLDRASGPSAGDRDFLNTVLRADFPSNANDDANTYTVRGSVNSIFEGILPFNFDDGSETTYDVNFPDVLALSNGSTSAFEYVGGTGGNAGVLYDGSQGGGKLVYLGFPFETIIDKSTRDEIMARVSQFFGLETNQVLDVWMMF